MVSPIFINDVPIEYQLSESILGVCIDVNMNFLPHIKNVCFKISKSIGVLYSLRDYLPIPALLSLYYALIYPYLNYCILIWGGACTSHLRPLVVLQKRAVRVISKSSYLAHTNELFRKYEILKLDDIYRYRLGICAFSNKDELFAAYQRDHSYETRGRSLLRPSFQRLKSTQNSLSYRLPETWNNIPMHVKTSNSLVRFKKLYKRHLTGCY